MDDYDISIYYETLSELKDSTHFNTQVGFGVYQALKGCLTPGYRPLDAAHRINILRMEYIGTPTSFLRLFWRAFLEVACQVPWFDDGQGKLVESISHLKSLRIQVRACR